MVERIALMSIHPAFANAIVDGRKTVEFRKRALATDVQRVLVYATSPIKRVIGEFSVARIVKGCPEDIWSEFGADGVISHEDYKSYYSASSAAAAIVIEGARRFAHPVALSDFEPPPAVPQSFSYLDASAVTWQ